ncbi:MAG: LysR family transcriptional regulator [Polaromonas sp.]|jgi:LysR family transcriptional activator of nhaA|nr:LysR family transcriptional regulator [Polaromonas sp.]MBK7025522.1 LysR family transcriptional regulator [Polaromonas sp.]MBP6089408.1 LysR family transcriptional regulator [Polaromonas sp.]MBP6142626.1 LysR family transcriptional regulator [Polaromonas sp.]MBP6157078.1 LysR family transcriptional regulator [Polaromonas sp.]
MSQSFNYRHLYYFWIVATEGSMVGAAKRLNMAIQTISTQVKLLEHELGFALFKPKGRGLTLTDAGVAALAEADHIFALGEKLPSKVRDAVRGKTLRLHVGISDGIAKMAVHRLLAPILKDDHLHLICQDGEFDDLIADLATHKLDLVLADHAPALSLNFKVQHQIMATSAVSWYATPLVAEQAVIDFPHCLAQLPVLLPTTHNALRSRLKHWFESERINPNVVGEFEDNALLTTFGISGMGVFPAADWLEDYLTQQHGLIKIAGCGDVVEHFHAIYTQRKVIHPLVSKLLMSSD